MKEFISTETNYRGDKYILKVPEVPQNFNVSDPSVMTALGSYPLYTYLKQTDRELSVKLTPHYLYEIPADKYVKMRDAFYSKKDKMNTGSKVYFFKDLNTPSLNFTEMLTSSECKRVRDISKADVIVIPDIYCAKPNYSYHNVSDELVQERIHADILTTATDEQMQVVKDSLGLEGTFISNTWWSRIRNVFDTGLKVDTTFNQNTLDSSPDHIHVAAGLMEVLYRMIKNGVQVYTETNFVEAHSNRTDLDLDTAKMIIKLLNSPTQEDKLMGVTVFAESAFYTDESKPYSYYIFSSVGHIIREFTSYKNVRNLIKTLNIDSYEDTSLPHLLSWYDKMNINLPSDMREALIENIMTEFYKKLRYEFTSKNFTDYFDVKVSYK